MVRGTVKKNYIGMNRQFRYRGEEQTRIETFSDAVFALAITFLVISQEVPDTFQQMSTFIYDLIPFAFCIALLTIIWYEHFKFFIRYGFRNQYIILLNTILLFVILLYVYPLKFLAQFLVSLIGFWITGSTVGLDMITRQDIPVLMIIYGLGASVIFIIFALMYLYALRKRIPLGLNKIERFDTKVSIWYNILMASVPLLSALLSFVLGASKAGLFSGFVYFLYWPVMFSFGFITSKKRKKYLMS